MNAQPDEPPMIAVPLPLVEATINFLHNSPGTYGLLRGYERAGILGSPDGQPAEQDISTDEGT